MHPSIPRIVVVMSLPLVVVAMVEVLLLSVFLPSTMVSKRRGRRVWHIITT